MESARPSRNRWLESSKSIAFLQHQKERLSFFYLSISERSVNSLSERNNFLEEEEEEKRKSLISTSDFSYERLEGLRFSGVIANGW